MKREDSGSMRVWPKVANVAILGVFGAAATTSACASEETSTTHAVAARDAAPVANFPDAATAPDEEVDIPPSPEETLTSEEKRDIWLADNSRNSDLVAVVRIDSEQAVTARYHQSSETAEMRILGATAITVVQGNPIENLRIIHPPARRHFEVGARALFFLAEQGGDFFNWASYPITDSNYLPTLGLTLPELSARLVQK